MKNLFAKILFVSVLISLFAGCIQQAPTENMATPTTTSTTIPTSTSSSSVEMRLATTTSTCDTGLLDVFNKKFEQENNVKISTICEGTGKAIATGELGAADVLMVHAVSSELKAVANGSFINRTYMMYNYFVIIGPEDDPAGVRNANNAVEAFKKIAEKQAPFISRGDESGTHTMEKSIWKAANITPAGTWYQSVGKGMGDTITTADIKNGYTLSDRGTYLAMKDKIKLRIIFEKDQTYLFNPYHVMAVNPSKFPNVKYDIAMKYINYALSPQAQDTIRNYGKDKYDEALFVPEEDVLKVLAAGSLKYSEKDIKIGFSGSMSDANIQFVFQPSGKLEQWISIDKYPVDVFFPADTANLDNLKNKGMVNKYYVVAHNSLVLIKGKGNSKVITLNDLTKPGVKVMIAKTSDAIGAYTEQMFEKAGILDKIREKEKNGEVIRVESATVIPDELIKGTADAGIIYQNEIIEALKSGKAIEKVSIDLKYDMHENINYGIGIIDSLSTRKSDADAFVKFMMSDEGQKILENHGFTKATESERNSR
jgi:tungstate transport system substrate-binding protein